MAFLLDTNVISEVRKPAPNPNVRAWLDSVPAAELYLSVLVVGEIRQGIERLRRHDPAQAEPYEAWLSALQRSFADRLVPITADVCEEWGRFNVHDPLPVVDGLLAATASRKDWTLVTRNVEHLGPTGVRLLNPFDGPG